MSSSKATTHDDDSSQSGARYEEQHVHNVYNSIASHFSSTRFKPWPVVDSFLRALPTGALGLDIGCGNGKYLTVRRDVYIIGSDRSASLLTFAAQHQPHDTAVADTLSLPHPENTFDFAISIAVVHHLSTRERRQEAVRCILRTLKTESNSGSRRDSNRGRGEALIFVWALEQKNSRRGWDVGHEQDVLVPWVLKGGGGGGGGGGGDGGDKKEIGGERKGLDEDHVYQRYYHLYRQGELEEDIVAVGGVVVRNGYDRDNWWAVCARGSG